MKMNKTTNNRGPKTHEGGAAVSFTPHQELRRAVTSCLLWENNFYESGVDIATRIADLVKKSDPQFVANLAVDVRSNFYLRHVPLYMCVQLARLGKLHHDTLCNVIQRADEITEFMALYWMDGKCPISNQVKKGLAKAFNKFDEYAFAKYNRKTDVTFKDVMFMTHPAPLNDDQVQLFKRIASDSLTTPDTWEVAISACKSAEEKTAEWTRLLSEGRLGGLALLRNLRNMEQAGVSRELIRESILNMNTNKILPFRFLSACRYSPSNADVLEKTMIRSLEEHEKLTGRTIVLLDNSGSMNAVVSSKSELTRRDAAGALAALLREICDDVQVYSFANSVVSVPNYRGFALIDAYKRTPGGGTYLGGAVQKINNECEADRLIIVTDEQSHDTVGTSKFDKSYMINVAGYQNGVGFGEYVRISGWSESIVRYIMEYEKLPTME